MAGKGIGLYADIKDTARKLVKIENTFSPNKENREIYELAFGKWKAAYAPQLRLSDEKITKYMWLAPGM
jgi:autoinducer 2 (AI-2) kinase